MKRIIKTMAAYLAQKEMIRKAIAEGGDFRVYTNRPTPKIMVGLYLIFFSYAICWPVIVGLGWIAFYANLPLLLIVGGPVVYALSSLFFIIGMYMAGKRYAAGFTKRLIKALFEKILGPQGAQKE